MTKLKTTVDKTYHRKSKTANDRKLILNIFQRNVGEVGGIYRSIYRVFLFVHFLFHFYIRGVVNIW